MDFTLNNGLSMIGGDDFTNIYEELDTLNDTVVFKAGTQTITGDKTITGDLVVDNANTSITVVGTASSGVLDLEATDPLATGIYGQIRQNADTKIEMRVAGSGGSDIAIFPNNITISSGLGGDVLTEINNITKVDINATDTIIENDEVFISNTAETVAIGIFPTSILTKAPVGGTITQDIGVITKTSISATDTTLTNDTTNIVSGASNKVAISSTATTLDNTTTNIRSGGTTKITTNATTTTLNNTGGTSIQIGGTDKISVLSASTTLNNTATSIQSGGQFKYSQNATDTQIRNTLVQLQAGASDVKYNQTATQTEITNGTILMNSTTALRQWSPTMSFGYDTTLATICSTMAFESLKYLSMAFNTDNTGDGSFTLYDAVRNYLVINTLATTLSSPASVNVEGATSVNLATPSGTNKYTQSTTATTLNNTTINLQNGGTTRYTQASGTTTLTNTSINATGNLYTSAYLLGTSGGSNIRLASIQLPLGTCLIPTASGSGTTTTTGNWSPTGTSTQIRTPSWGKFYPLYAMIGLDNGSITGGGTMTFAVQIREETNNYTLATTAQTLTSGTSNASTGGSQTVNVFSGANQYVSDGVLIRFQIVISRTATISASTKSINATFYGYQTN